jgi:cysteine desulfurase/selenocysteine lyase
VIDAVASFYARDFANIHRGSHTLSNRATEAYEHARQAVGRFLGAASAEEIVFVRNCTEAINLVAASYARPRLVEGDEVLVSEMEHHSNLIPWQRVCAATGARLRVLPVDDSGQLDLSALDELLSSKTRLVAITHVSNVLGTVNPVADLAQRVHDAGAVLLVDGAQGAVHAAVDVQQLGCDFYAVSGHKLYGPTGIGALYGRAELLAEMEPYQSGGGMVDRVELLDATYLSAPLRFEAGTPNIGGAIGLAEAVDYLAGLDLAAVHEHEQDLMHYGMDRLSQLDGLRIIGSTPRKTGVISFTLDQAHASDISMILDQQGVAIRAGHHCAQPLMQRFGVPATARASFGVYTTRAEIDTLVSALEKVIELFS